MSLCCMNQLLYDAKKNKYAVGAFSVGNMEMVIGAVKAAEYMNTPIILQIAEVRLNYSPLHLMAPMMLSAAKNAKVDIAVHLDHGLKMDTIQNALDFGFTSIMYDGSRLNFEDNIKQTLSAIKLAKKTNVAVEAELGLVGGSEDNSSDHGIRCTDPLQAAEFCKQTGVDALAVAIGNAHGDYPFSPTLCFDVLKKIQQFTDIPLVLHGGSGISDCDFRKSINLGISKINIATSSFSALTQKSTKYITNEKHPNYFALSENMAEGVYENVKRHILVFNNKEIL